MNDRDDLPVTQRLSLRRFTLDDIDQQCALTSDPEVMRYVGGVKDRAQTEEMLRTRILAYYEKELVAKSLVSCDKGPVKTA